MSYDLYFTKPTITREQFMAYFGARPNYQVSKQQCLYQNEDTGVYFIIDYNEANGADDPEAVASTASLTLNYFRPHFFGLEAVEEIAAFVEHFGFSIQDPQNEGMGDGPFSKEGFLRGWNFGNAFGYSAILKQNRSHKLWTLPGARLEAVWRWNFSKAAVQAAYAEDRFVPRVMFMAVAERAVSVAVWPDAICELIPEVDYVLIGRDELAPKGFLGRRKKDEILLPFDVLKPALEPYATAGHSLPAYELPTPQVPEELRTGIRTLEPTGITGEGITPDKVLNEEIVAKIRKG